MGVSKSLNLDLINLVFFSGAHPFRDGDIRDVMAVDVERIEDIAELRVAFLRQASSSWWWWSGSNEAPKHVKIYRVTLTSSEDGRR